LFSFTSISQYHEQLYKGEVSCADAVNFYLKKIDAAKKLNAFVEVFASESMERAKQLDRKRERGETCGKLFGAVVAIKDVICYKDHKVTAASAILKNFTSLFNSTAVDHLLKEDAIIIGSCNCDEFAMGSTNENSSYGRVLNALSENKVPGGSSGGSAVAVQAGLCMVSLGSDTGGSVRQPADFCGIVGVKPTYGYVSRHGLIAYASSFDQIGVFANNVEDCAKVLGVIGGADNYDSTVNQQKRAALNINTTTETKYRIGILKNAIEHQSLDEEIKNSIYQLAKHLQKDHHEIEEVNFDLIDFIVPAYYVLTTAESSSNLARYDGVRYGYRNKTANDITSFYKKTRSEGFGKEVKRRIMLGTFVLSEGYYDAYFTKAQQIRRLLVNQTEELFKKFDIIILPTAPSTAFEAGKMQKDPVEMYLADIYTVYANLTGNPAISIPLFKHSNQMPFGVQAIAKKNDEVTLLQFADMLLKNYKQ
jgi:aspartyl-tRNA(Asn)/glutamyl-tRNA(Gln) amidotransferase subunit A